MNHSLGDIDNGGGYTCVGAGSLWNFLLLYYDL